MDTQRLTALVISTFEGRTELLSFLKENLIMQPVAAIGSNEHWPYFREGQNQVVRMLIEIMEKELHVRI